MPEMLTRFPESAFAVLKSAGAKCGVGMKQQILTSCPPEDFCALPHGEICVYSIKNITKMTQMGPADLADLISSVPTIYSNFNIMLLTISCIFGIMMGIFLKK